MAHYARTTISGGVSHGFAATASAEPLVQNGRSASSIKTARLRVDMALTGKAMYKTTDRTVVRVGTTPTSWSAVKIGHDIDVTYHLDGQTWSPTKS